MDFEPLKVNEKDYNILAAKYLMTLEKEIKQQPAILSIREGYDSLIPICTEGNISVIKGHSGVRKTTLTSILISSILNTGYSYNTFFSHYKGDRSIVYIDTEQGEYHAQTTLRNINKIKSPNFFYYAIAELSSKDRAKFVLNRCEVHNPILIVIDGIRDLILNFNDITESQELIDLILGIKARHDCHVCNIIHLNKSDGNSKGHLGAFLQEKSETVMNVAFSEIPANSVVECEKKRGDRPFSGFLITNENGIGEVLKERMQVAKPKKSRETKSDFWSEPEPAELTF